MTEQLIPRLKITGTLTNKTALMIGSGREIAKTQTGKDITSPTYTAICLADEGKPYIPASSLRGLLLSLCNTRYGKDSDIGKALFGSAKNNANKDDGNMGALRIYDAVCATLAMQDDNNTPKRTRNAINPVTGTAKDNFLYSHAYVPESNTFNCEIEADNLNEAQIKQLLGLLGQLDASPFSQLGKGKSNQQGLIAWQLQRTETLGSENLQKWLTDGKADSSLPWLAQSFADATPPTAGKLLQHFSLTLTPQSPILINDPERVKPDKGTGEAKLEYYRDPQGQLLIPASSLKGVMRSHCRKILLTLLIDKAGLKPNDDQQQANRIADGLIGELFGGTGQQSNIWLSDAVAENTGKHTQTFNAVDRFTGGVADGALYTANAATATAIKTDVYLKNSLDDWQKGLLILLLRDAMEGDLTVGWGKAKGFGSIVLTEITNGEQALKNWPELCENTEHLAAMQSWLESLNTRLDTKSQGEQ